MVHEPIRALCASASYSRPEYTDSAPFASFVETQLLRLSKVASQCAQSGQRVDSAGTTEPVSGKAQFSMEGDPLDPITTYGPQTDKAQYDNICKFLRKAREDCVNFLLGGPPMAQEDGGLLVPPTLAHNPPEDNDLMKEGVFGYGLVLCCFKFNQMILDPPADLICDIVPSRAWSHLRMKRMLSGERTALFSPPTSTARYVSQRLSRPDSSGQ